MLAALPSLGGIAADAQGNVFGVEVSSSTQGPALWRYAAGENTLKRNAISLPEGDWQDYTPVWTRHPATGALYFTDAAGRIFALKAGSATLLAQTAQRPILTMAAMADDRIFGMCGDGICRLFGLDLTTRELKGLAPVASVLQSKRYGHLFACATLGRDGQIVFGENDNYAHLWLYFPRVKGHPQAS